MAYGRRRRAREAAEPQQEAPAPAEEVDSFEDQDFNFDEGAETIDFSDEVDFSSDDQGQEVDFGSDEATFDGTDFESDQQVDFAEESFDDNAYEQDEVYEDFEEEVEEAPARGSRRGRGRSRGATASNRSNRSGRKDRQAGASERKKSARKSKKAKAQALTPEQLEARRAARRGGILIFLLMVAIIGGGVGFYFLFMKPNPRLIEARKHIDLATSNFKQLEGALQARDVKRARDLIDVTMKDHLEIPMFANATGNIDPNDPEIVNAALARQAHRLLNDFDKQHAVIDRIEDDRAAESNYNLMNARFSKIGELTDPGQLEQLRADALAFNDNPIDPLAGPNPVAVSRYRQNYIIPIETKIPQIDQRLNQLQKAATTDVVSLANTETDLKIKLGRFGDALRYLDDLARENPRADLAPVRKKVSDAAQEIWTARKRSAAEEYKLATDSGSRDEDRAPALARSHETLQFVIDNFGADVPAMQPIIEEARQLLSQYGG